MPTVVVIRRVDTGRIEVEVVRVVSGRGGRRPELAVDAQIAEVRSADRAIIKIETPAAHEVRQKNNTSNNSPHIKKYCLKP